MDTMEDIKMEPTPQYTILRIKRKRTEEPLDALVISSDTPRKKSRASVAARSTSQGASGVFEFAETIEEEQFWEDERRTKGLRDRITNLSKVPTPVRGLSSAVSATSSLSASPTQTSQQRDIGRRYTVIKAPTPVAGSLTAPSTTSAPAPPSSFNVIDAVPEELNIIPSTPDPEMDAFLPLLKEYLKVSMPQSNGVDLSPSEKKEEDDDEEYVWDIFYHRPTLSNWSEAAMNVATVSGVRLPKPIEGIVLDESDDESIGDEDDEDSNAEEFYRNDYPDEEESDFESDSGGRYSDDYMHHWR